MLEDGFAVSVDVGGRVFEYRLPMHRFPERTSFDVCGVECHSESFYVGVWLAVGCCGRHGMGDCGYSTNGFCHDLIIGFVLILYFKIRVEGCRYEPVVRVGFRPWIAVDVDSGNVGHQAAVELMDVFVVGNVVVKDCHLRPSDACGDVGQAVVVANHFVLIVGIVFACLCGVPHHVLEGGFVGTD